jgi:hypothetical protein
VLGDCRKRSFRVKRLIAAVIVCLAVSALSREAIDVIWKAAAQPAMPHWAIHVYWPVAAISPFLGIAAGTLVARGHFAAAAAGIWLLWTSLTLTIGYQIQLAALPVSLSEYLAANLAPFLWSLVASVSGFIAGRWLNSRQGRGGQSPNNSSKPTPLRGAA